MRQCYNGRKGSTWRHSRSSAPSASKDSKSSSTSRLAASTTFACSARPRSGSGRRPARPPTTCRPRARRFPSPATCRPRARRCRGPSICPPRARPFRSPATCQPHARPYPDRVTCPSTAMRCRDLATCRLIATPCRDLATCRLIARLGRAQSCRLLLPRQHQAPCPRPRSCRTIARQPKPLHWVCPWISPCLRYRSLLPVVILSLWAIL